MRATIVVLATLLVTSVTASLASADAYPRPTPPAPDMCGPGLYYPNCCGYYSGPYFCVRPPWQPVGTLPPMLGGYPSHPYARSPRDFFMVGW